jgi:hypothetical protein
MMKDAMRFWLVTACLLGAVALCGTCGAADITAAIGDRVNLTGTTVGTDTIYLFVTGPGLAPDGVRLDNMRMPVVTGMPATFTVVDVSNDRWAYSWNTARQGFTLKEGIYTVYATKQPVSRADISSATYGTIEVSLTSGGGPFLSGGTVIVTTSPVMAEVYLDDSLRGLTPQNLIVPVGTYTVRLESAGYQTISESITVQRGSVIEINRTMVPLATQTTEQVTTTVMTPVSTIASMTATTAPVTTRAPAPVAGILTAILVVCVILRGQR